MGMTKKLLIVFASGLMLSLVLLSSAWLVGGDELRKRIGDRKSLNVTIDGHGGPEIRRELVFNPDLPLTISAPVTLRFTRGEAVSMTVSGAKRAVDAMVWEGGKLTAGGGIRFGNDDIEVSITAPRLSALILSSAVKARLEGLDQPDLKVETRGAVDMEANGRVENLDVSTAGASEIDLEDLSTGDAKVVTRGASDVTIAATGKVDVEVNGVGSVSLRRRPAQLTSRINGIGSVDNDY